MNKIKELRLEKKNTLQQIADFLKITQRNYQRYEKEEVDIPSSKLIALADYFDVSLDYLVGRSEVRKRR